MNDRECLRTPTNVWRSFCDHCNWWRIAFVSPFALYSPLSGEFAANIFFLHSQGYSPQRETSMKEDEASTSQASVPYPRKCMTLLNRMFQWKLLKTSATRRACLYPDCLCCYCIQNLFTEPSYSYKERPNAIIPARSHVNMANGCLVHVTASI